MDKRNILFIVLLAASFYLVQYIFPPKRQSLPPKAPTEQTVETKAKKSDTASRTFKPTSSSEKETFYVIENEFQMLVFSTKGGSISEINLPFKSKSPLSVSINFIFIFIDRFASQWCNASIILA